MEVIWVQFVQQAPALAVLVFLVVCFLGHLKHIDTMQQSQQESCHNFQREMMGKASATSDKVIIAFDRNTEALGRNNQATERLASITEDCMKRLERHDARDEGRN
jgi:hypothetical protein